MARYLITTADERSWKFDRPVLFLGEWCRRYDRKHIWSNLDAIVAGPFGLEAGQKLRCTDYVMLLAGQILTELAEALNKLHQTQHSERYWNIVLGHWLQRYVALVFNRYNTLDQAIKNYGVTGTTIFEAEGYSLATTDSLSFIWACNDDLWNHVLYSRIMAYRGDVDINLDKTPLREFEAFGYEQKKQNGQRPFIKRLKRQLMNTVVPKLARNTDAFIINSYLPVKEEIKLQLAFGQVPQLWQSPSFERYGPDAGLRANLMPDYDQHEGFERYVRWQLSELIPACFLEGYQSMVDKTEKLPWPKNPKFIFTSNNFDTDEIFKVWTGSKVEQGVTYYVGQHGNYRPSRWRSYRPELVTNDKFFTWGWADEDKKNIPAFVFKVAAAKHNGFNPEGGLLLIELHQPLMFDPTDDYYEFGLYQEEQFRFVEALPIKIQKQLTVRLHSVYRNLSWSDEQRWKDRNPSTQLETGMTPIRELTAQNRLILHSYDSTGTLETILLNIPTMCFWHGGLDYLLPGAKPYYDLLRNAGILADTPEQAAELVVLHWDNVSGWWGSQKVQEARRIFCEKYAKTEKYPVRTMKRLLTAYVNPGK